MLVISTEYAYSLLDTRTVLSAFSTVTYVAPLSGNGRLTIPVVKRRCARDALAQTFYFGVLKCSEAILHVRVCT